MPPALAFLLCSAFVLALLRLERKQAPTISPAQWIPTIWLMACASKPLASWFNNDQGAESYGSVEAGSPLDRAFYTALLIAGVLVLSRRKVDWRAFRRD